MVDAGDLQAAQSLGRRLALRLPRQGWEYTDAVLTSALEPGEAVKRLAQVGEADARALLLGLCLGPIPAEVLQQRYARLRRLIEPGPPPGAPAPPPVELRFLAALACGDLRSAEAEAVRFSGGGSVLREAAAELVDRAKADPQAAAAEAARLLRASLAADMAPATLARTWALEVLQARPTCQWAAGLAVATGADPAARRRVLETLKPPGCLMGLMIEADLRMDQKQYDEAAALFQKALQRDRGNPRLAVNLAIATERAGRLKEALDLYRGAGDPLKNPNAANNAAYLVTQLHPDDAALLAEAEKWIRSAVDAAPGVAAFRDTLGWVACLRGRHEEACAELRRAVKGLPDSPEVHYHLGVAEAAAGRAELARWHLAAAVDLGKGLAAKGEPLSKSAAEAVDRAREELAKLNPGTT
jgi:tetratricopeptide (TPR) repeat protein